MESKAEKKLLSMLGLASRAGRVESGEFSTEKAVKSGKACLAIAACDASENTKKHFRDMCTYYEVPFYLVSDRDSLGHAIGRGMRVSLAITDENLAGAILKLLNNEPNGGIENGRAE